MAPSSFSISIPTILIFSTFIFPIISSSSPTHHHHRRRLLSSPPPCSAVLRLPPSDRCSFSRSHCSSSGGLINYSSLHFCHLNSSPLLSFTSFTLILILLFYLLTRTASDHFSPTVSILTSRLQLSPSMAAVTLLALGNGAPDFFASIAAIHTGQARTGLAAVVSAGAFVSAFVVGAVAAFSPVSHFVVEPSAFIRDVFFYLIAASAMFYIYLSAEIFVWQAVGLVVFYVFFVGLVFWMDSGVDRRGAVEEEMVKLPEWELEKVCETNGFGWGLGQLIGKVCVV